MNNMHFSGTDLEIAEILNPQTIRTQCKKIYEIADKGGTHFSLHMGKMPEVVDKVVQEIKVRYPDLKVPFHSRFRHFEAGGIDRIGMVRKSLSEKSSGEIARSLLDLTIVSVLLDAGAGPDWKYKENLDGNEFARSEGLGVASCHMFCAGLFSGDEKNPMQVDRVGLKKISMQDLEQGFQVTEKNPLVGLDGRLHLLHTLGRVLEQGSEYFGEDNGRLGGLWDYFVQLGDSEQGINGSQILSAIQQGLGSIWPKRASINWFNLGDVWVYDPLGTGVRSLIPFHKLSQWITYSVIDLMDQEGITVHGLEDLTALAEYRNGGLCLDSGLIKLRKIRFADMKHQPGDRIIVEWRALTVVLIDRIATGVRDALGLSEAEFPLAKVLEGGTWWVGRRLAQKLRKSATPPLNILSDGTVF